MKLNFKQRSSLIAIIILWLVTGLLLTFITDIVYVGFMEDITGPGRVALIAFISLVIAVISIACANAFDKGVKAQNEIMTELETNGYTDRFISLSIAETNRIISTGKVYKRYRFFSQYMRQLADAYLMRDNLSAAVDCINHTNLSDMKTYLNESIDANAFLGYFDVQMSISEELCEPRRAVAIMQDAEPYLKKNMGTLMGDLFSYEIYSVYHLTLGDFDRAFEYANKCLDNKNNPAFAFVGNALMAKIYAKAGMPQKALEYITALENLPKKTALQSQAAQYLRNKLPRTQ